MICRLAAAVSLALMVAAPLDAAAGPEEEAAELAERGRLLFDGGEYAEALKRYRAAYALHAHPTYLFNQGRAAAKMGECKLALDAYRAYVESPENTNAQAIDYATEEIARLEPECGDKEPVAPEGDGGETLEGEGEDSEPADTADTFETGDLAEPSPGPPSRRPWQIAAVAGAGVTVGLFAYWVFEANRLGTFGGDGHYTERVLDANARAEPGPITGDICDDPQINGAGYEEVKDACDAGNAASTRADVVMVSMVATAAATAVFAYFGFIRPAPAADTVSLGPGPGDLGVAARVSF